MKNLSKKIVIVVVILFAIVALIQLLFFSVNINKPNITNYTNSIKVEESDK